MDIIEIRSRKHELENQIFKLISNFQNETDLKVRKVHLNIPRIGEPKTKKKDSYTKVIIKSL